MLIEVCSQGDKMEEFERDWNKSKHTLYYNGICQNKPENKWLAGLYWKAALEWVLEMKRVNRHPAPNTGGAWYHIDDWDVGRIEREVTSQGH
jgi:hypothetical protein